MGNRLIFLYLVLLRRGVDGMLGGLGEIAPTDEKGSRDFIEQLFRRKGIAENTRALDCGAGIGRVTRAVLLNYFAMVDFQEQYEPFAHQFQSSLTPEIAPRIGGVHVMPLQTFVPTVQYDCIWIQWVLAYLKHDDLIQCLRRLAESLKPGGYIVIKENVARKSPYIDEQDNYVVRMKGEWLALFREAGMNVSQQQQMGFPREIFPVFFFALQKSG